MPHKIEVEGDVMLVKVDLNGDMNDLNKLMGAVQDGYVSEIISIAKTLKVSDSVAQDIWYLRTRSRWTQALENQLVAAAHAGKPIDSVKVCNGEWPRDRVSPLKALK